MKKSGSKVKKIVNDITKKFKKQKRIEMENTNGGNRDRKQRNGGETRRGGN